MWALRRSLLRLVIVVALLYVVSLALLLSSGLSPAVPWGIVAAVLLVGIPFSITFLGYRRAPALVDLAGGIIIVYSFNNFWLWIASASILLFCTKTGKISGQWRLVSGGLIAVSLGYASLWNVNYILARYMPASFLHDNALRAFDVWFYSLFSTASYTGIFPLVHSAAAIAMFSNAYSLLFVEVLLVLLIVARTGSDGEMVTFIKTLFGFYLAGICFFLIYPAIGPCLYFPESLRSGTALSLGMLRDFNAAKAGGSLEGLGYFVAMPSLHVLIGVFLQYCLRHHGSLFRLFLPINTLLVVSTVVLGYHYILDVVCSLVIIGAWIAWQQRRDAYPAKRLTSVNATP